ncbi:AraC family transcriptional regulator [Luteimonas sp. SX5]|uniref:AraC family transcriptional regulator n=1 Tax=Luteimonas galliterrae TaxID=2940486 RepID=A0ABT0MH61_9GAMM|nr:AraC family transcriptional regulator [Luteimonas galliterrae]MCL1634214.1 AraC family transcriptional regulator [Luteimonas galliterrae]
MQSQLPGLSLPHGRFFGQGTVRREAAGFLLDCLQPTVPERELHRHTHDEAHFVMLLAGRYITSARGGAAECAVGTLIYNPPGTTHRDRFRGLDGRFFTLSVPQAAIALCDGLAADGGARQLGHRARRFAYALVQECGRWEHDSDHVAGAVATELLADAISSEETHTSPPAWLRLALEWLEDVGGSPDIATLAAVCGVHPVHLARVFRRHLGCAPAEYARRARLRRAMALLRDTRATVAEIALRCGYADQSHFNRQFVSAYRVTPAAYRRRSL